MAENRKNKLGKGLGALLSHGTAQLDAPKPAPPAPQALPDGTRLLLLDPTELLPNPKQPRRHFDEDALAELSESIRRDGVQEPVIVRPAGDGKYELVSGERRCRASILADLKAIPAVCRDISDREMLKLGLIENIQREDLNAIELAAAYQDLVREFDWTQEQLADEVGKKRATVANTLRLLQLPEVVQEQVADGSLSMGHARALLALESPAEQAALARKIIADGLSVRQAERLAAAKANKPGRQTRISVETTRDPNISQVEDDLRRKLGTKVSLKPANNGRGKIEIEYFNNDELERLLALLRGR